MTGKAMYPLPDELHHEVYPKEPSGGPDQIGMTGAHEAALTERVHGPIPDDVKARGDEARSRGQVGLTAEEARFVDSGDASS